ncbi:MAG: hypothetical protein ACPIOQ_63380, partial [Promethearchaeia archaeon]
GPRAASRNRTPKCHTASPRGSKSPATDAPSCLYATRPLAQPWPVQPQCNCGGDGVTPGPSRARTIGLQRVQPYDASCLYRRHGPTCFAARCPAAP